DHRADAQSAEGDHRRRRPDAVVRPPVELGAAGQRPAAQQDAARVSLDPADLAAVTRQLGRAPRGTRRVAHRCPCGLPDVIETAPRWPAARPFRTRSSRRGVGAGGGASGLEAAGLMREMPARLRADPRLGEAYLAAHRDYAARRTAAAAAAGVPPLPPGTATAGGMPDRVKCLHALAAQELAVPGSNPLGREAVAAMGQWWAAGPCVELPAGLVAEE